MAEGKKDFWPTGRRTYKDPKQYCIRDRFYFQRIFRH